MPGSKKITNIFPILFLDASILAITVYILQNITAFNNKFWELSRICSRQGNQISSACVVEIDRGLVAMYALIIIFLPFLIFSTLMVHESKLLTAYKRVVILGSWLLWSCCLASSVYLYSRLSTL